MPFVMIVGIGCSGCVGLVGLADVSESEDRYPAGSLDDVHELILDVVELETILDAEADPKGVPCVDVNALPPNAMP